MSHSLPVAPPPPPPPTRSSAQSSCLSAADVVININECIWASEYPDLQTGCYLSRVCEYEVPQVCQYYAIPCLLQVGPTCGLAALAMLLNGQRTAAELQTEATALEYTRNGEMFSAQYLYEMTRKHLLLNGPGACQLHDGRLNCPKVKELLRAGGCLLVPYPFSKSFIWSPD